MERKGWLLVLLSLVFAVGMVSGAGAKPRHAKHHAKAVTAEKGGEGRGKDEDKGSSADSSQGKGSDKGESQSDGKGAGAGDDHGKSDSDSHGNSDSDSHGDSPQADGGEAGPGGPAQGKGNDKTDSSDGPGQDKGKSDDNPGRGATPDAGVSGEVPPGLLDAPGITLDSLPEALQPRVATDVLVAPQAGQIFVQDGDGGFVPMDDPGRIPVGAFVDARQGVVALVEKLPDGSSQTASFSGSKFQVRQTEDGLTVVILRGSSFRDICGRVTDAAGDGGPASRVPAASAARARSKKVVRSLWASDHNGRFQTYGRNSVATVRGTVWQTVDRCDGTLIRVAEGEVVVHDRRKHKDVVVTAGHSYLARDPQA